MDLCRELGWLAAGEMHVSPQAGPEALACFHLPDYVDALRRAVAEGRVAAEARERYGIGTMENPIFPGLFERAATCVGGSMRAAELALEGRIAYHPAGGMHHGRPGRASGFCYFNDVVLAILVLLRQGVERVLYVDLDAHHGDAVQDAFADEPRVFMISMHEEGRWPHTGRADDRGGGNACNLPVPAALNDSELERLMQAVILPIAARVAPQAVVVTCGADALAGDPLSSMALSNGALWSATESLVAIAPAALVLGGGGYNPWTLVRYWSGLWARIAGHEVPQAAPPGARRILAGLKCDLIDDEDVRTEWLETLADAPNAGPVRPAILDLARRAQGAWNSGTGKFGRLYALD